MDHSRLSDDLSLLAIVGRLRAAGCVFAEDEAALLREAAAPFGADADTELERMLAERESGRPLELVLGWAQFASLRIRVAPGVFVPRRRTELMVEIARDFIDSTGSAHRARVLDLCCGSGAVGAALATARPGIDLFAADIEPAAVACARDNLAGLGTVFVGDLFGDLPDDLRSTFDVITCNAPYVPTDDIRFMPPEARDYEPTITLDGGADGLDVHRRVIASCRAWLAEGGVILFEASERQAPVTAAELELQGLRARIVADHDEDRGGSVVVGRMAS